LATEKNIPATQQPLTNIENTNLNGAAVTENKKVPVKKAKAAAAPKAPKEKAEKPAAKPKAAKKAAPKKKAEELPAETSPVTEAGTTEVLPQAPVMNVPKEETVKPVKAKKAAPKKSATVTATAEKATIKKAKTAKPKAVAEKAEKTGEVIKEKAAPKKAALLKPEPVVTDAVKITMPATVKLVLQLTFHTKHGQNLFITGNHEIFGNGDINKALAMRYISNDLWSAEVDVNPADISEAGITYNYVLRFADGILSYDWGSDKVLKADILLTPQVFIADAWNHAGYFENAFYTEPFSNVLLKENYTAVDIAKPAKTTHLFKIKAPLLTKGQTVAITGDAEAFGGWKKDSPVLLSRKPYEDQFTVAVDLSTASFPITYKYVVYDVESAKIVSYEDGSNRTLKNGTDKESFHIINDGFIVQPNNTWKGAGVSIPVFSLRSKKSFGVGEFTDLKLLVDWAKRTGLKLIQILPVNDTTATHSWVDSYPYAAISAFALHPLYLNLSLVADAENKALVSALEEERARLNKLDAVDYEAVTSLKWKLIEQLYPLQKDKTFTSKEYIEYFETNRHWLTPYAAFCYLKEKNGTPDFSRWPGHQTYNAEEIRTLIQEDASVRDAIGLYYFVQYHLHLQLKEARDYAHSNGVIIKGDIPIGVYRYGADAWQQPDLYHMDMQAGAPPDDFAVTGQNWGFPTYNWEKMKHDGFAWWRQRFEQMSYYFDSFRIDHILGFFRIWSIPYSAVEGIMGRFAPAIPVNLQELYNWGIPFEYNRFCKPYITDKILNDIFGDQQDYIRRTFVSSDGKGQYFMRPEFSTQRQVEDYFSRFDKNQHNKWLKQALFSLLSNVILFEVEDSNGQQFHFRFAMDSTISFKQLDGHTQYLLKELYVNYFFRRQDNFWQIEAMQKLPGLKRVTNMLVCGEDLGLVPACVPDVMKQLGILSLEIQRMPKNSAQEFFHPGNAPYLSVVTPSTHDMSTLRAWWEEDRNKSQRFYNQVMGEQGYAPYLCDAWVNKAIVVQHLQSPAMWSIFQMQDLLGMNAKVRRDDPFEERINVPANPRNYWRYRMHVALEDLLNTDDYNDELAAAVKESGR